MRRREFLMSAAGAVGLMAGVAPLSRQALAEDRPFTFTSWGGALSNAEKEAFIDPFGKLKNVPVINTSPTETAKIKAMVEAQKVEWDLVDVGGRTV